MYLLRRARLAAFVLAAAACSESAAQGWDTWPQRQQVHPEAVVYEQPGEEGAQIIVASKTGILEANGVARSFAAQGDAYDQLAFALSVLSVDIGSPPPQQSRDGAGQAVLSGMAYTESGERAFAAVLTGRGEDGEVRVLLASPEAFGRLGGARALDPEAKLPQLADPAPAPVAAEAGRAAERRPAARPVDIPPRPITIVNTGTYPVTLTIEGWTYFGPLEGPVEDLPGAARVARVDVGVGEVSSLEEALQAVFEAGDTRMGETTGFHEVKALPSIDGNQGWLIAGAATRGGVKHRFLANVGRNNQTGGYSVHSFQAPEAIYAAWGGPTFFAEISGQSVSEVLTPQLIASVTDTTPDQDVQIADMIITQSINVLFAQMSATMGIVSSMQGLGNDIAARTDCIMTDGCVPGQDNQGRTIMTFPTD